MVSSVQSGWSDTLCNIQQWDLTSQPANHLFINSSVHNSSEPNSKNVKCYIALVLLYSGILFSLIFSIQAPMISWISWFFSRDSDLTTSVVRPWVSQLVSQSVSQSLCLQNPKTSINQSLYHQECYNKGHKAS